MPHLSTMNSLGHAFNRGFEIALSGLFPPRCAGCNCWNEDIFCATCREQLRYLTTPLCQVCGKPFDPLAKGAHLCAECRPNRYHKPPAFTALRSCYVFEGPVREAVHRYKYENRTVLAVALADVLAEFWQHGCGDSLETPQLDVVTAVPLHWWRRYRRGYNQSELLANRLAEQLQVPAKVLLQRIRPTRPQIYLGHNQRAGNVKNAFVMEKRASSVKKKSVLLIDDVCTTGATLRECARVLKRAGAQSVYGLTLARQIAHDKPHASFSSAEEPG